MPAERSNGVIGFLTKLVSIAYFGLGAAAVLVLVGALLARPLGAGPEWEMGLNVPVSVRESPATVPTSWGPAQLKLDDVRAELEFPIVQMPWWLFALIWMHAAVYFGLVLLSLYQLRRIFQSVRQGIPFDAGNAVRLRSLGMFLVALAVFNAVSEFVWALALRKEITNHRIAVETGLHIDMPFLFLALAVVALAEIFRRGAELEAEHSLVI